MLSFTEIRLDLQLNLLGVWLFGYFDALKTIYGVFH